MSKTRQIRQEIVHIIESYYSDYPEFFDTQFNPQIGAYPPVAIKNYGDMNEDKSDDEWIELVSLGLASRLDDGSYKMN